MRATEITSPIARHLLWRMGEPGGMEPGRFVQSLLEAISCADPENKAALKLGFAGYVMAHELATTHSEGIYLLQQIAEKEAGND